MKGCLKITLLLCAVYFQSALGNENGDDALDYYFGVMDFLLPSKESETSCFYYPEYYEVDKPHDKSYLVVDQQSWDLCKNELNSSSLPASGPDAVFLLSARSNCSVVHNFVYVKDKGAGVILLSNHTYNINQTYGLDIFAIVQDQRKIESLDFSKNITVKFYMGRGFNFSTLVLWFLAVFCILVGSCTGTPSLSLSSFVTSENHDDEEGDKPDNAATGEQVGFSMKLILLMVVFITTTLLLLYFFYKYLVYVFIAIFCIASARATYNILQQILYCCRVNLNFYKIKIYGVGEMLLALLALSVPIVWFVYRKNLLVGSILQDLLGVFFCINMIQTLRIPNLKFCTTLLSMLFIYDIFFVFITPFFTSNGKSIMGEVATGGSGSGSKGGDTIEALPLLLKVPQIGRLASACSGPSLLGFGDIIVPGLLTGFAHTFDVLSGNKYRPYFISTFIGYILGLTGAFVALYLTNTGQPALLYIVPAVLVMIFAVGLCKKEVKALWKGVPPRLA